MLPIIDIATSSDASGTARLALPLPFDAALRGVAVSVQGFVVDPQGALANLLALTGGLRVVIGD